MAQAKVQKKEEAPQVDDTTTSKRLTTDDFIRRPVTEIFKKKANEWRSDFLVKGAL